MPQRASVFCNFYIRVDREALVSKRALDVGSIAFKAMSTKKQITIFGAMSKNYYSNLFKFHCTVLFFRTTTDHILQKKKLHKRFSKY
jgi:hypothetical protein